MTSAAPKKLQRNLRSGKFPKSTFFTYLLDKPDQQDNVIKIQDFAFHFISFLLVVKPKTLRKQA